MYNFDEAMRTQQHLANDSLVRGSSSQMYLWRNNKLHAINDINAFWKLGLNVEWKDTIRIKDDELMRLPQGETLY